MTSDNEVAEAERRYADAPRRRAFEDGARWAARIAREAEAEMDLSEAATYPGEPSPKGA